MKRIFDVSFSLFALVLFLIPMSFIVLLLFFKEKHKIFFRQKRIGKNGKTFEILKFQTLVNDLPTRTGKFLRKTGLDELPQFINVLKGDMSIVGPRALTAHDIERLKWNHDYYNERWSVKPGITGFAQIYGGQHKKTSWFWDRKYLNRNNVCIDFQLLAVSFMMNIFGKTKVRRFIFQKANLK